ncbi:MAG: HD domain-containing protein [Flavobacteriales bacterium]|nr:HD domain-containing protein [Flavobacteriales bacterium]MBT6175339.1 HD domain-containing protein [Flavobacteriales bacterium]
MSKTNRYKILNDPIYGFVTLRHSFTIDILDHPYVQRLRRISQLGLSHLVYPGAVHNRFQHAVGSMFLMQEVVDVLRTKGVEITREEDEAVCFAILLHDIGHGPFSHALEHSIVKSVHHEDISIMIMDRLNKDFDGKLTLAIKIFKNEYSKKFLHQLVSSQLDMDRLDYLARDSFYSGVTEGKVGSERIIKMLSVSNDQLVVEEKGIYSVEKFIVARRLMYWQVYLHRTVLCAEHMLTLVLRRAKQLAQSGSEIFATPALSRFINNDFDKKSFISTPNIIDSFCELDDSDVFSAMKAWRHHSDKVLSSLSSRLLDRKLFRIELRPHPFTTEEVNEKINLIATKWGLSIDEASYFVSNQSIENRAYTPNGIIIKNKDGTTRDFAESNDHLSFELLTKPVRKSFLCYPKDFE